MDRKKLIKNLKGYSKTQEGKATFTILGLLFGCLFILAMAADSGNLFFMLFALLTTLLIVKGTQAKLKTFLQKGAN